MKNFTFRFGVILISCAVFLSCSKEEFPNEVKNSVVTSKGLNTIMDGPKFHTQYIYGPSILEERQSGTYKLIGLGENVRWYYRDNSDYSFLQGGTGLEFTTHFYLRGDVQQQISQVKVVFQRDGETITDILNVTVTAPHDDSTDGALDFPDDYDPIQEPCDDPYTEPCSGFPRK